MLTTILAFWGVFCIAWRVWGLPTEWAWLYGWLVLLVGVAVIYYEALRSVNND